MACDILFLAVFIQTSNYDLLTNAHNTTWSPMLTNAHQCSPIPPGHQCSPMLTNSHQCHLGEILTLFPNLACTMPVQHCLQLDQGLWEGGGGSLLCLLHGDPMLPRPGKLPERWHDLNPSNLLCSEMPCTTNSCQIWTRYQAESSVQVGRPHICTVFSS